MMTATLFTTCTSINSLIRLGKKLADRLMSITGMLLTHSVSASKKPDTRHGMVILSHQARVLSLLTRAPNLCANLLPRLSL